MYISRGGTCDRHWRAWFSAALFRGRWCQIFQRVQVGALFELFTAGRPARRRVRAATCADKKRLQDELSTSLEMLVKRIKSRI